MTHDDVAEWIRRYERAWRAPGTDMLPGLFTEDATYLLSPYEAALEGLDEIAAMWDREREGPDEIFQMTSEVFAVEGDRAVATLEVRYGEPVTREYRDIWLLRFEGGRCAHFEEWAYWPERPYTPSPKT